MGISLAPEQAADEYLRKPKKPLPLAGQPTTSPGGVGLAPIPAPTIAAPAQPVDRVKLSTDIFNTTAASTQGAYDAASRENVQNSAAMGQVASGGLRTREGNLQLARGRDLDQMRERLVNSATEGSIADASTAYQQQLASSQQGLAAELGLGGLDVSRGGLALEKERFATGADQAQQQINMAKKQQEINTAFEQGRMTLAQRNLELAELSNAQQFGLATAGQDLQRQIQMGQLTLAQAQQTLDEKYRSGQMSLAEKNQALAELTQRQGNENDQQRIGLAREQLAQTGAQFGLSLAQQKELATLADKTQNRQLDISSAQGRNMLLLELARIMGGTSGNVDPNFLAKVAEALGMGPGSGASGTPRNAGTSPANTNPIPLDTGQIGGTGRAPGGGPLTNPIPRDIELERDPRQAWAS